MIRFEPGPETLGTAERYGLDVLLDVSRVLPVHDQSADVVRAILDPVPRDVDLVGGLVQFDTELGAVSIPASLLRSISAIAGGGEEQRVSARDSHGRVPSSANPLASAGRHRAPVINALGAAFRSAVQRARGQRATRFLAPWPEGRRWAAAFTHDLDVVSWWPLAAGARIGELVAGGEYARALQSATAAVRGVARDPVTSGVQFILDAEADAGVRSTWFVICETPTLSSMASGDVTYRAESRKSRTILRRVIGAGHEVGLHGSFATVIDTGRFLEQRQRLERLVERPVVGVRQHFLRMRPGQTQRMMLEAGFRYDATYGFPDRNGFRLGVGDVVPGWDEKARCRTTLEEIPLVWMDRALSKYQRVESPGDWVAEALALGNAVEEAEGLWVGLWHPNLVPSLGFPEAPSAFRGLLTGLAERKPYIDTLESLVQWRIRRRSARATTVAPDGRVEVRGEFDGPLTLVLEDESGRLLTADGKPAT